MFFILITIITLILWIIIGTAYLKLHPFLVLFAASILLGLSLEINFVELLKLLFVGFSETTQKIGLLIIFGTIIGKTLEHLFKRHSLELIKSSKQKIFLFQQMKNIKT